MRVRMRRVFDCCQVQLIQHVTRVSYQLTAINCQLSAVSYQLSAVMRRVFDFYQVEHISPLTRVSCDVTILSLTFFDFWLLLLSPAARISCDVTILREDSISFSPCSNAVLIPLIDSLVDVSSSSLNAAVNPKIIPMLYWVPLIHHLASSRLLAIMRKPLLTVYRQLTYCFDWALYANQIADLVTSNQPTIAIMPTIMISKFTHLVVTRPMSD